MLEELAWRIRDGEPIEAHNAFFEQMVWEFCWMRDLPWMPLPKPEQWFCSAAKAASFSLPRKLESVAQVLGVSEQKDMEGHRIMMKLCKPARKTKGNPNREWYEDPVDLRKNWNYNIQDTRTERAISGQLRPLSETQRRVWLLDQKMNKRGVLCDRVLVDAMLDMAGDEVDSLNSRLREITGDAVPKGSSRAKLKSWVNSQGVRMKDTKGETVEKMLSAGGLSDDVSEVIGICRDVNKTSLKKLVSMTDRMCDGDRIRDLMMFHGASTGRWAGTGMQLHNFPRGSVKNMGEACDAIMMRDPEIIRILYGSVMEHLSGSLRGALHAPEGRDLIVADFSAIEARDVFWLAEDEAGLEDFRASDAGEGPEVYCVMAESIFGYPVTKALFLERFVGKQSILGCGYGMGWEKYMDTCAKFNVQLEEKICRKAIDKYRDDHAPVREFWGIQENAAKEAVRNRGVTVKAGRVSWAVRGEFLHCKLPSDRLLSFHKPMISSMLNFRFHVLKNGGRKSTVSVNESLRRGEAWAFKRARRRAFAMCKANDWMLLDKKPFVRDQSVLRFWGQDSKTKKWRIQETYGGKIVENITQAVAYDQLAEAMLRIDAGGLYDMLFSVHDEAVGEVDEGVGDLTEFELEMAVPPAWCLDVPLVAEGWRGKRYRKS